MRSLSVTTMSRTSLNGPWRSTRGMRSDVLGRDPGAPGPPDDVAVLLAGAPDGGRVDDGQELGEVLRQQPVEQRRVAVLECREPDVALERVVLDPQVLQLQLHLLVDGEGPVRAAAR